MEVHTKNPCLRITMWLASRGGYDTLSKTKHPHEEPLYRYRGRGERLRDEERNVSMELNLSISPYFKFTLACARAHWSTVAAAPSLMSDAGSIFKYETFVFGIGWLITHYISLLGDGHFESEWGWFDGLVTDSAGVGTSLEEDLESYLQQWREEFPREDSEAVG